MRIDYSDLNKYLAVIHGKMRKLQIKAVSHLKKNLRCILDSYMGTGKTLMLLTACFLQKPQRVLIVCSKNALWTWHKEILKWFPEYCPPGAYLVVRGTTPAGRRPLWSKEAIFYVCTYGTLRSDIEVIEQMHFDVLIMDEFHKSGLRQHTKSKKRKLDPKTGKPIKTITGFGVILRLAYIKVIYLGTGTMLSKGPQDAWGPLHFLASKVFPSYWRFINTYCVLEDNGFGQKISGTQNTEGLAIATRPYWYKVDQAEAEAELPPLTRQRIEIEMTSNQRRMYERYERDMYLELVSGKLDLASTSLSVLMKQRQILCCPMIVDPDCEDYGAAIENIVDMAQERENPHIVVFTPFRAAVPYFKDYLKANLNENVYHIWGGTELEDLRDTVEAWKRTKGAMVCTIQFSQSFELETANTCYYCHYEWDQNENDQASSRLRRLISPGPIHAYYMEHQNTIDQDVLEIVLGKRQICKVTTQDFATLAKKLEQKYGRPPQN